MSRSRLRYFYSQQLGEAAPQYGTYAARVRELLERYVGLSNGKLKLEIYNPMPFSDEEDLAVSYGLQGVPVNQAGEQVYFGVAASATAPTTKARSRSSIPSASASSNTI